MGKRKKMASDLPTDKISGMYTEMKDLKQCQIDFLKISVGLFAIISSTILGYLKINSPIHFFEGGSVDLWSSWAIILLLSIIPFIFPYIAWIIIHKCRSLFRISAYIRIIEDYCCKDNCDESQRKIIYGYESLYRIYKEDPLLLARIRGSFWKNYLSRFGSYKWWLRIYDHSNKKGKLDISNDTGYKGGFYSRVVRLIIYMQLPYLSFCIFLPCFIVYTSIAKYDNDIFNWHFLFFFMYLMFILIYSAYNHILLMRYQKELMGIPFSQDSQYQIWKRAIEKSYNNLQDQADVSN